MPVTFQIYFDRPDACYMAGETVGGKVIVTTDKIKKIRDITLQLKGEASVHWSETDAVRKSRQVYRREWNSTTKRFESRFVTEWYTEYHTIHYRNSELYIQTTINLAGSSSGSSELAPGVPYEYVFTCRLPSDVPSSFEGVYGHIRYTVKVTMHRPWKFDHCGKAAFTVLSNLDLNDFELARIPIEEERMKTMCCWCCTSGPLSVIFRLPSGGFVPGQVVVLEIQVDNASRTAVDGIEFRFVKEVRYRGKIVWRDYDSTAPRHKTKITTTDVMKFTFDGVGAHDSKVIRKAITVPALPPSLLAHCDLIDISYRVKVKTVIEGPHFNMKVNIPVLVGTIPLIVVPQLDLPPTFEEAVAGASAPPLPITPTEELPPPSYEECIFKGNTDIMDPEAGDNEYTMGAGSFTPRYPVWSLASNERPHLQEQHEECSQQQGTVRERDVVS